MTGDSSLTWVVSAERWSAVLSVPQVIASIRMVVILNSGMLCDIGLDASFVRDVIVGFEGVLNCVYSLLLIWARLQVLSNYCLVRFLHLLDFLLDLFLQGNHLFVDSVRDPPVDYPLDDLAQLQWHLVNIV